MYAIANTKYFSSLGLIPGVQNLAISCSMVCLINLATAWTLGTFGIFGKQNSAILVTGIMYFLTGKYTYYM